MVVDSALEFREFNQYGKQPVTWIEGCGFGLPGTKLQLGTSLVDVIVPPDALFQQ